MTKYVMPGSPWNEPGRKEQLLALRAQGLSFSQIAKVMGLSRMQVGNKLRHLRLGRVACASEHKARERASIAGRWTEENLTARWADRHVGR